ncbi:hypothetical protein D4R87_02555 [bacterium]|nr:MAG: hypothetical protein D4R87_02555 [bacterium]
MKYKKLFGNILKTKDNYRLIHLSDKLSLAEIWVEEKKLYNYFLNKSKKQPLSQYEKLQCISSGWEWSVFEYTQDECLKISTQIFEETLDIQYLKNTEMAYKIIKDVFGDFVAKTRIDYKEKAIYQEKLLNNPISIKENKGSLISLFEKVQEFLGKHDWMPDINVKRIDNDQIFLTNVMQNCNGKLKIIDFTYMYDPFRIHPKITAQIKRERIKKIGSFLKEIERS